MKTLNTILDTMFIELAIDRKFDTFDPWGELARMELALVTSRDWEVHYENALILANIDDPSGWVYVNVKEEAIALLKKYSQMESEGRIYPVDWDKCRCHWTEWDSPLTTAYRAEYEELPF